MSRPLAIPAGRRRAGARPYSSRERRQREGRADTVGEEQIDRAAFAGGPTPFAVTIRAAPGAVDAFGVDLHPLGHLAETLGIGRIEPAVGHRADVEQVVAVARDGIDKVVQQLLQREGRHRFVVDPAAGVDRLAHLPRLSAVERRDHVLEADEVLGAAAVIAEHDAKVALVQHLGDARGRVLPFVGAGRLDAVEPHHRERTVVRGQLVNQLFVVGVVAVVVRSIEVRVLPVLRGNLPAERDSPPLAGSCEHRRDVLAIGRSHDAVVGGGGVEHAEGVMVLGNKDRVADPGVVRQCQQGVGIVVRRVELLVELVIDRRRHAARRVELALAGV